MEVLNVHQREIQASKGTIIKLLSTLASKDDKIWPKENWPKMKLKDGLQNDSEGGHGPIRYRIVDYKAMSHIIFKFQKPEGFHGIHKFEIAEIDTNKTRITHTIKMNTSGMGTVKWLFAIKWLHNALIEDGFDKIQNQLSDEKRKTEWNFWVKILRFLLKPK